VKDLYPIVDAEPDLACGARVTPRDVARDRLKITRRTLSPDYLALHCAIRDIISALETSRPCSMSRSAS
jgi:hypothetical protein